MKAKTFFGLLCVVALCLSIISCSTSKTTAAPTQQVVTSTPRVDPAPTATKTVLPTPSPFLAPISGSPSDDSPASTDSTADEATRLINSPEIQAALKAEGYVPVYFKDADGKNTLSWIDQNGVCWFNTPDSGFDPTFNALTKTGTKEGIAHFDPVDGGIPMDAFTKVDFDGIPKGYACLGAVLNDPDDPDFTQMRVLLYNTTTNEALGYMQVMYAAGEKPRFVVSGDGRFGLKVGTKTLAWLAENGGGQKLDMASLVPALPVPRMEIADFKAVELAKLITVDEAGAAALCQDILTNSPLGDPEHIAKSVTLNIDKTGQSVFLVGFTSEAEVTEPNLMPVYVFRDADGNPNVLYAAIVTGDDGKHHLACLRTTHIFDDETVLDNITNLGRGTHNIFVSIILKSDDGYGPWDQVLEHAPAAKELQQWLIDDQGQHPLLATTLTGR